VSCAFLSIPGNRLTHLGNLDFHPELEELHIANQGISSFKGCENLKKLKIIDAGYNCVTVLSTYLDDKPDLEDLWLNNNKISSWTEVEKLKNLPRLETVYLEHNPIHVNDANNYRRKVIVVLSQVKQIDAIACRS